MKHILLKSHNKLFKCLKHIQNNGRKGNFLNLTSNFDVSCGLGESIRLLKIKTKSMFKHK